MQLKDAFFHSVEVAELEREEKEINNNAPAPLRACGGCAAHSLF